MQAERGRKYYFAEGDAGIGEYDPHEFDVEFLADVVAMTAVGQQQLDCLVERVLCVEQPAPEHRRVLFVQAQRLRVVLDVWHAPNLHTRTDTMNSQQSTSHAERSTQNKNVNLTLPDAWGQKDCRYP